MLTPIAHGQDCTECHGAGTLVDDTKRGETPDSMQIDGGEVQCDHCLGTGLEPWPVCVFCKKPASVFCDQSSLFMCDDHAREEST